jgi:mono/diheme cytochrome c family protein
MVRFPVLLALLSAFALSPSLDAQVDRQPGARGQEARRPQDTDENAQPSKLPPLPPGMTLEIIREGDALFYTKGGCAGCHGPEATGMPNDGSALTTGLHAIPTEWHAIDSLVTTGMPEALTRTASAMPPRGEHSDLTAEEIRRISAYVWAISQVRGEPWPGGHAKHPMPEEHGAKGAMPEHGGMAAMAMMAGPLGIPMAREGSGTSWLPDSSPMYARHTMAGSWQFMGHGNAFLQYLNEGSDRGDDQFGSINWLMGMARRPLADGVFTARTMLSAEPFTVGACGYPDLLATGEFCNGQPLHDRQHPHDLFMELAAGYERAVSDRLGFQVYGGPVAEPALGPTAYPHRISALPNPIAPVSHHWLDATHISFGVVTAGAFSRRWKLEGSVFNGREPDEDRYDWDLAPLDSYSGRLWYLPNEQWSFQVSVGRLNEAEPARNGGPAESLTRPTASVTYQRAQERNGSWASTVAWGANIEEDHTTNALLIESVLNLKERNLFFGRAELVEKTGADLALEVEGGAALVDEEFRIGTIAVGYARQFQPLAGLLPGIGARLSVNFVPQTLTPFYGQRGSLGIALFASLRPGPMSMGGMKGGPEAERGHEAEPSPEQGHDNSAHQ